MGNWILPFWYLIYFRSHSGRAPMIGAVDTLELFGEGTLLQDTFLVGGTVPLGPFDFCMRSIQWCHRPIVQKRIMVQFTPNNNHTASGGGLQQNTPIGFETLKVRYRTILMIAIKIFYPNIIIGMDGTHQMIHPTIDSGNEPIFCGRIDATINYIRPGRRGGRCTAIAPWFFSSKPLKERHHELFGCLSYSRLSRSTPAVQCHYDRTQMRHGPSKDALCAESKERHLKTGKKEKNQSVQKK